MTKVSLEDASATQLADFAVREYGLDLTFRKGKDFILAQLEKVGYDKDHIELDGGNDGDSEEVALVKPMSAVVSDGSGAKRMISIVIDTTEGPGGSKPVPVGVNGKIMLIPRGKEVPVPYEYYRALKNAKMVIHDPSPDGKGTLPPREVPSYPVTVVA